MQIKFRTYRHRSRIILPAVLVFLLLGFGSGMRICTALLHHDHALVSHSHVDTDHSAGSHGCDHGDCHGPNHQLSCDTCGHQHIRISVHDTTRSPQVQPPQPVETPLPVYLTRTSVHPAQPDPGPDAPPPVLLQNVSPIVLLI